MAYGFQKENALFFELRVISAETNGDVRNILLRYVAGLSGPGHSSGVRSEPFSICHTKDVWRHCVFNLGIFVLNSKLMHVFLMHFEQCGSWNFLVPSAKST